MIFIFFFFCRNSRFVGCDHHDWKGRPTTDKLGRNSVWFCRNLLYHWCCFYQILATRRICMKVCFHQQITKVQIHSRNNKAGETFRDAKMLGFLQNQIIQVSFFLSNTNKSTHECILKIFHIKYCRNETKESFIQFLSKKQTFSYWI